MNQEEQAVLNYYIAQLGVFFRKGRDYLRRIAQLYIDSGYVPQYRTYLFQVAREENRKPESVRGTIRHFLQRSWEQGFAPE